MTSLSIQAVIFDMDGVLIDSEPLWQRVEYEVLSALGVPVTIETIQQTTGLRIDQCVDYWYHKAPWADYDNAKVSTAIVDKVAEEILRTGEAMQGVQQAIDYCQAKGLKIGLATSSFYTIIEAVLSKLGLSDKFMAVQSAEGLTYGKPHPEVYLNCAAALGVDPRYCLAIEDSFNGLIAARAANMQTVAIPAPEQRGQAKWVVAHHQADSLLDLPAILG
ncbi:hexitol phosphatase HxpB [Shewanella xiamenensis]|uniref:2-deoxyglucose-6-phosphatase n=1 Tax=Shewanella decolorationis S12 TaxID=1353536 RepID=A0ABP2Z0H6_9GAMM|nr:MULTISPECIES: hexitol phosphatase HxpB [Shewanella]ABK46675.1 HAD-superfamily hydrolase, subfamily IA, variant 3 [Shewanella sp. ANA-3]ESE39880.1 2-deoxyglucose-6-phosphatase [Shewanella decolorationis S12]MDH1313623.1 hexitol phosphatase HxpB [Shewanella xiamenensis]MDH1468805.1 hexitol phosphatase HxpB [Shewanella sp. GD03713]ODR84898.1 2-deoxyglucose-6-phosphatase [Shewanella xiamenensis]